MTCLISCYRYLASRGRVKRHTLAVSNPIHEVPEELQMKLQPIRPSRRSAERGACKFHRLKYHILPRQSGHKLAPQLSTMSNATNSISLSSTASISSMSLPMEVSVSYHRGQ